VAAALSLRPLREDDLPTMFEIQLDDEAQRLAAFVGSAARDREAYLAKWRKILLDPAITTKAIELDGNVVGSVGVYPIEGGLELTYWIRKDSWAEEWPPRPSRRSCRKSLPARCTLGSSRTTSVRGTSWNATASSASAARKPSPRHARPPSRS